MSDERNKHGQYQHMAKPSYHQCKQYQYYHVMIQLEDGRSVDGIILDVDDNQVKILVSEEVSGEQSDQRQFGYGGYGGRYRYRRFRPNFFPLAALTSLALLPYFRPYPYYPYPYYY